MHLPGPSYSTVNPRSGTSSTFHSPYVTMARDENALGQERSDEKEGNLDDNHQVDFRYIEQLVDADIPEHDLMPTEEGARPLPEPKPTKV